MNAHQIAKELLKSSSKNQIDAALADIGLSDAKEVIKLLLCKYNQERIETLLSKYRK